jgi:hypothetical protein
MTTQDAIKLAQQIATANPAVYSDGDRFGDMALMACAYFVLHSIDTERTDAVNEAIAALESSAAYTETTRGYEGFSEFADGSIATCFQATDYAYATDGDFFDDFPDLRPEEDAA